MKTRKIVWTKLGFGVVEIIVVYSFAGGRSSAPPQQERFVWTKLSFGLVEIIVVYSFAGGRSSAPPQQEGKIFGVIHLIQP